MVIIHNKLSRKAFIMDFEFIDEGDIEGVKRGRKSQVPQELIDLFKAIPAGKAVRLSEFAGDPTDPDYKTHKQNAGSTIRQASKQAGIEIRISWSPAGVPQVSRKAPKRSAKSAK
jgi:hypothetical protein